MLENPQDLSTTLAAIAELATIAKHFKMKLGIFTLLLAMLMAVAAVAKEFPPLTKALPPLLLCPQPNNGTCQTIEQLTYELNFLLWLPEFLWYRGRGFPKALNWTSDGCTHASDNPFGWPFLPACQRHDFGYTNYRLQGTFYKSTRKRIDRQFKRE